MSYTYKDLNIVYEDNHIIVVVKPQNIPTQPDSSGDLDMISMLKQYLVEKYNKPGKAFLGMVHRLDRPTGGVMVFAKTSKAATRLSVDLKNGDVEKRYLAVLRGRPKDLSGNLVHHLQKNLANNKVSIVPLATVGAKRAELYYKILQEAKGLSLVSVDLITGRTHQIRVQMASLNTPVFADVKYGEEINKDLVGRKTNLALWSTDLKFTHPTTKEKMFFRVFPPKDEIPWVLFNLSAYLNISIPN